MRTQTAAESMAMPPATHFTVRCEKLSDLGPEITPLILAHGEEIGANRLPYPFAPLMGAYIEMETNGRLKLIALRDCASRLRGYSLLMTGRDLMLGGIPTVSCYAMYVDPAFRSSASLRMLWSESKRVARESGAVCITRDRWILKGGRFPSQMVQHIYL